MRERATGEAPRSRGDIDDPRAVTPARQAAGPAHLLALQRLVGNRAVVRTVQRKYDLSPQQWVHISSGEVKKTGVVGYHWTGLGEASAARKKAGTDSATDRFGAYTANVESRPKRGQEPVAKTDASTFFPDDWDEATVKEAIAGASPVGGVMYEALGKGKPYHGMRLFTNKDSVFPEWQGSPESEDRGGGGKKKKKGR